MNRDEAIDLLFLVLDQIIREKFPHLREEFVEWDAVVEDARAQAAPF